jgi:hypothetical protein
VKVPQSLALFFRAGPWRELPIGGGTPFDSVPCAFFAIAELAKVLNLQLAIITFELETPALHSTCSSYTYSHFASQSQHKHARLSGSQGYIPNASCFACQVTWLPHSHVSPTAAADQWISLPSGISAGSVTRPCDVISGVPSNVAWQQQQQQQQQEMDAGTSAASSRYNTRCGAPGGMHVCCTHCSMLHCHLPYCSKCEGLYASSMRRTCMFPPANTHCTAQALPGPTHVLQ